MAEKKRYIVYYYKNGTKKAFARCTTKEQAEQKASEVMRQGYPARLVEQ